MTKRIKISDLPEFDAAEYLNSEEDIAAYLTTVIEENDPALLAAALGDIARARGMSQVAKDDRVEFVEVEPGRFELIAATQSVVALKGLVRKPASSVTVEAMNEAIANAGAKAK